MSEPDTSDALQAQIDEAKDAGDDAKAQALYQRQQGTDLHGDEAASSVPAVSDTSGDAATDLPGLPAPPEGEWTFARPEVVNHQFAIMEADFGELATDLRSEWGADAGRNLEFALATSLEFEAHYPELVATVAARGAGADPLIVELLAQLGRQWTATPGDPRTVRLFPNTGDRGHARQIRYRRRTERGSR